MTDYSEIVALLIQITTFLFPPTIDLLIDMYGPQNIMRIARLCPNQDYSEYFWDKVKIARKKYEGRKIQPIHPRLRIITDFSVGQTFYNVEITNGTLVKIAEYIIEDIRVDKFDEIVIDYSIVGKSSIKQVIPRNIRTFTLKLKER